MFLWLADLCLMYVESRVGEIKFRKFKCLAKLLIYKRDILRDCSSIKVVIKWLKTKDVQSNATAVV